MFANKCNNFVTVGKCVAGGFMMTCAVAILILRTLPNPFSFKNLDILDIGKNLKE